MPGCADALMIATTPAAAQDGGAESTKGTFTSWRKPLADRPNGELRGGVDRGRREDEMACNRRGRDDVARPLLFHMWQGSRNAVENTLDVHVNHPVPFVRLEAFQSRQGHDPGVVAQHVNPAEDPHSGIDEIGNNRAIGHVRLDRQRLAARRDDVFHQRFKAVGSARAEERCSRLAPPDDERRLRPGHLRRR